MQPDITGADFLAGSPLPEYILRIVMSSPGHWKEKPAVGVNVWLWMQASSTYEQLRATIIKQLTADVFISPLVDISQFPVIVINDLVFTPS